MAMLLTWMAVLVPTSLTLAATVIAWRRARATRVVHAPAVTVTMFAASIASGWFVTLAALSALSPVTTGAAPPVTIPFDVFRQELLTAGFVGGVAGVEVVAGLSPSTIVPAVLAQSMGYLPVAAISALVALGCHAILLEQAFRRRIAVAAIATAAACLVFGSAQQMLSNLAAGNAHVELARAGAFPPGATDLSDGLLVSLAAFNPWPVGAAAGFVALAIIIRQGERVREAARGLV